MPWIPGPDYVTFLVQFDLRPDKEMVEDTCGNGTVRSSVCALDVNTQQYYFLC